MYTDGACSGNPGPGGWGVVLMSGELYKELHGGEHNTTNNRMELLAVISGFRALKRACEVDVYSDSAYVVNAFLQGWVDGWIKNGWRSKSGAVKNPEVWQELLAVMKGHVVRWHKVKGHADNKYNNRCDELARLAIKELPPAPTEAVTAPTLLERSVQDAREGEERADCR